MYVCVRARVYEKTKQDIHMLCGSVLYIREKFERRARSRSHSVDSAQNSRKRDDFTQCLYISLSHSFYFSTLFHSSSPSFFLSSRSCSLPFHSIAIMFVVKVCRCVCMSMLMFVCIEATLKNSNDVCFTLHFVSNRFFSRVMIIS